ncbi:MAG: Txe/YoeB family addiction module toxin [Selenomonadaceae bacterium]|nr:Txe/YoeB family addiction module toxin [Selenomonadaceae bacterium]
MEKKWSDEAWDEYLYWQMQDKKTLRRINSLIKDIERNGVDIGIGKPEKLKYRDGWSRRIDDTNRLVYDIQPDGYIYIISCQGHYED